MTKQTAKPVEKELSLDAYRVIRSEIEHEDQLINHRLSWLVSSQSFLLTAFAISVNAPVQFKTPAYEHLNALLFKLLPYAGLASTVLIYPTILAAIASLFRLRRQAGNRRPSGLPPAHGPLGLVLFGLSGPLLIPWVFAIVWGLLLQGRGKVF